MSWSQTKLKVLGNPPPEDTIDLRNSFIEGVLGDTDGVKVIQHELHKEIQGTIFNWQNEGVDDGVISAPYGSGKSQQVPIGLAAYFATLYPERPHIIISADPDLAKNRISSLRQIFESPEYELWCKLNDVKPAKYSKRDTNSSQTIILESKNRTGVPTFFAAGIETKGTGWRCRYLWGDDTCNNEDFKSQATREARHKAWTNTWTKRLLDGGQEFIIRTPYHPEDANEKLIKTGIYAHLEIAVKEDKSGYTVKEWRPIKGVLHLIRSEEIPLWEVNHSRAKLIKEEAKDYAAYQLGFCMKKEVRNPENSTYLSFSDADYPEGNVGDRFFDWLSPNPLVLTADFNVNPMSWALGQKQDDKYVVLKEIIGENITTEDHAISACEILQEEGHSFVELHGDGTSNQGGKKYGRSGQNDWMVLCKVLESNGITYRKRVKKSNPQRNERVKVVSNTIFSQMGGEPRRRLIIDRSCQTVIDDYKFSVRDGGELKKIKQGKRGHISDAVDYWIYMEERGRNARFLIK